MHDFGLLKLQLNQPIHIPKQWLFSSCTIWKLIRRIAIRVKGIPFLQYKH